MAFSLIASNAAQLITNLIFLSMLQTLSVVGTFTFFLLVNVGIIVFVYFILVETRQITPEVILTRLTEQYHSYNVSKIGRRICSKFYDHLGANSNDNSRLSINSTHTENVSQSVVVGYNSTEEKHMQIKL